MHAVKEGTAVVIANGLKQGETILDIVKGKPIGTLITRNGQTELAAPPDAMADEGKLDALISLLRCFTSFSLSLSTSLSLLCQPLAREGSYALQSLTSEQVSS